MDAQLMTRNARYLEETVATAPPSKLLTLLYDRLVRDLEMGEKAIAAGARSEWVYNLDHAREILTELLVTLDPTAGEVAGNLASIYSWMVSEIIGAAIHGDAARVGPIKAMAADLRTAWHDAAAQVSPSPDAFTG